VAIFLLQSLVFWLYFKELKSQQRLQRFLLSLTHEIKTPLATLMASTESHYPELHQQCKRLSSQLENILELSRFFSSETQNKITYPKEEINLKRFLETTLNSFKRSYPEIECHFFSDLSGEETDIETSPFILEIIFKNLLENTCNHASSPQKITVFLKINQGEKKLEIFYKDNGPCLLTSLEIDHLGDLFSISQKRSTGLFLCHQLATKGNMTLRGYKNTENSLEFILSLPSSQNNKTRA